ncbi:fibronectin type III domain-containing protein [Lactococcus lactis]|uniref:fibronectin type III domain-containing protein n=1 Tax=Lactococcus lactis TaxID=1358 RepID=UPI0022E32DBA|nr:fibronectin type III domain-containing protein [Lactococcus lactis]MDA2898452.1 fibronectin type III domain-containing protein [Lactococcus lactis]
MADKNYLHTAYANSAGGTDGFTTIYPNLNLLENGKFAKPISSKWNIDGTTISKDDITGYFKVQFNGTGSLNRVYYTAGISNIPIGQKYSLYIKAYSLESSLDIKLGSVNSSQSVTVTNNSNVPKTYKVEGLVRGNSDTFGIFGGLTTTRGTLFISEIKVEPGSVATPYIPSASEVTTADWPKYVGTYVDTNPVSSTNSSKYDWDEMKYRVYLDGTPIGGSKLLSFDLENLKAGTSYNVQVSQINGNIESDKSESVAFKTTLTK